MYTSRRMPEVIKVFFPSHSYTSPVGISLAKGCVLRPVYPRHTSISTGVKPWAPPRDVGTISSPSLEHAVETNSRRPLEPVLDVFWNSNTWVSEGGFSERAAGPVLSQRGHLVEDAGLKGIRPRAGGHASFMRAYSKIRQYPAPIPRLQHVDRTAGRAGHGDGAIMARAV
jgi:hypothetical protein